MKSIYLISFAFLLCFESCTQTEIAQWRGPERNGIYPEKNLLTSWPEGGPQLLWKFDSLGAGYSSAAVISKRVFTVGTVDSISYVFSFNLDGKLLWKRELGKEWMVNWPGIRSTPNIYGNLGYVMNGLGILFCFNASNGDIVWSKDIVKEFNTNYMEFGVCENLIVDEEKVYCTTAGSDADVVAFDRKTGAIVWKSKGSEDAKPYASPIFIEIGGRRQLVTLTQKLIFALDTKNGDLIWKHELKGNVHENTPFYRDGYLLVVDGWEKGSFMLKLDDNGNSVTEVWYDQYLDIAMGDAIVLGNRIYGYSYKKKTYRCIDWNTGQEIFSDTIKTQAISQISAMNLIYYYKDSGVFSLAKPCERGFEILGTFKVMGGTKLHCSHPVIKNGRLYIRHDNSLFVYNISKEM